MEVRNLRVSYGALVALDNVSWRANPGEILGVIGPNGAGKSTCFDAVSGLVPRSGEVYLFGDNITSRPAHHLACLGMKRAFQQNAFFGHLSVLENMTAALGQQAWPNLFYSVVRPYWSGKQRREMEVLARARLDRFRIPSSFHHRRPSEISYGMQRMLSIAMAYGLSARVLMLDEPAAGLGGTDMTNLIALLEDLKGEGIALIVIEHHMELIMGICDQIYVLDLGRPLAYGRPDEIQKDATVVDAYLGAAS